MARLVFLGSPALAVGPLRALVDAGHDVALVVSGADKRRGRGSETAPSPVKAAALDLGLEVTDKLTDAVDARAELGVVVAYGRIIPPAILAALPMVNLHFSLLPRWRGAAPLERAILAGDAKTGVCLMEVVDELDAGRVYARAELALGELSLSALQQQLSVLGADLLVEHLGRGLGVPDPQVGDVTYAKKIGPDELEIDWNDMAESIVRLIRLERAWTIFRGQRLGIVTAALSPSALDATPGTVVVRGDDLEVATGAGTVRLLRVQPASRRAMDMSQWLHGTKPVDGERFERADQA